MPRLRPTLPVTVSLHLDRPPRRVCSDTSCSDTSCSAGLLTCLPLQASPHAGPARIAASPCGPGHSRAPAGCLSLSQGFNILPSTSKSPPVAAACLLCHLQALQCPARGHQGLTWAVSSRARVSFVLPPTGSPGTGGRGRWGFT